MKKSEEHIQNWIDNIKNNPDVYSIMFDTIKKYAKKYDYFDTQFEGSLELVFNTNLDRSNAYIFMNVLIKYKILTGRKNEKRKIYIDKNINSLDNLEEFLYIVDNDISLNDYSRYKKLKKLKNG